MTLMNLSPRDRDLIGLVAAFGQLSGVQLGRLVFHACKSETSRSVVLRRLVDTKMLAHVGARQVGGWRSGSAGYVYQLGREGWKLERSGEYRRRLAIDWHGLGIADVFVSLTEAERDGRLTLKGFTTEPDCHEQHGSILLTPDARIELESSRYWLEVDMGTERSPQLIDKCQRYWHACQRSPQDFPTVLFVVPDTERAKFVRGIVAGGPDEAQGLFRVVELQDLTSVLA